ncbi:MAG: aspartate aminotransferase family protein [Phycisphaeraceae bacterium]|nr:MAG: aspartate aminotransferase family protein [Phycisphaeraceae bacterium]
MQSNPFRLDDVLASHSGRTVQSHAEYVNPAYAQMLRTIGFDTDYVRGYGAYLFDAEGQRYIDCLGGYGVYALGRNHPGIGRAIQDAIGSDLPSLPGIGPFRLAGALAEELVRIAPDGLGKVYFCNSGTEGVEAAIKMARRATGKRRVIFCDRAYHGLTLGALSVNGNDEFRDGFGPLPEFTTRIPFNDLAALESALSAGDVAAFIVEPIQGKGVNIPDDSYLQNALELCHRHKGLLIVDEVQTGIGRTGKMFACEHWGIEPDIMVIAKALGGGYIPSGAVLMKDWICNRVFSSMSRCCVHQVTFGMNDLAMVAGLATLHYIREERIIEHTASVGESLLAHLRSHLQPYEMVKSVRGKGLMVAIEFGPPRSPGLRVGWELLHKMDQSLFCQAILMPLLSDHRILAQVAGHRLDVIKLIPPLVLSENDAIDIAKAFEATVAACHRFPGPAWEVGRKLGTAAMKRFGHQNAPAGAAS